MLLLSIQSAYTEDRKQYMHPEFESNTNIQTSEKSAHIIDYPGLLNTVQLSAARLKDIPGSIEAESFADVLASRTEEERQHIIWEVGSQFDDALISYVTAILIHKRHERVIILANATEGINGGFPWQPKLEQHVQNLQAHGHLPGVELSVERYTTDDKAIEQLTQEARLLAAE